jgi:hypothetical protein
MAKVNILYLQYENILVTGTPENNSNLISFVIWYSYIKRILSILIALYVIIAYQIFTKKIEINHLRLIKRNTHTRAHARTHHHTHAHTPTHTHTHTHTHTRTHTHTNTHTCTHRLRNKTNKNNKTKKQSTQNNNTNSSLPGNIITIFTIYFTINNQIIIFSLLCIYKCHSMF